MDRPPGGGGPGRGKLRGALAGQPKPLYRKKFNDSCNDNDGICCLHVYLQLRTYARVNGPVQYGTLG